jgi:hypothetical protein
MPPMRRTVLASEYQWAAQGHLGVHGRYRPATGTGGDQRHRDPAEGGDMDHDTHLPRP